MAYRSAIETPAPGAHPTGVTAKDVRLTLALMGLCVVLSYPLALFMESDAPFEYPARAPVLAPDAGPDAPPAP